jgi:sugar lactone lactonase YvrE
MIGAVLRPFNDFLGRGEAAVTVPPLDGALRPNRHLDEASARYPLSGVDCLATVDGELLAAVGDVVLRLDGQGRWQPRAAAAGNIACIAAVGDGGLAIACADGDVIIRGGAFDGQRYRGRTDIACVTAMASDGSALYLANGSASNKADDWQRDLLERNATGSVWRIALGNGAVTRIAKGLAFPAGIAVDSGSLIVSEAWRHRLIRLNLASRSPRAEPVCMDLPGYPGRIAPAAGGWWLAVFAPRSQLVELVLREPRYRRRMLAEVPQPYWVAPTLRSGRSFYEPLQGGGVKHLGILKPWAPAMSAGLCVRLDAAFQPNASLHSRADGRTHGITSVVERGDTVLAAARGDGVVVALPRTSGGEDA